LAAEVFNVMDKVVKENDASDALLQSATRASWDMIVIGAGPAGALAARQFANSGLKTLLIDAKQFPREKVCGGYLNNRALEALRLANLTHLIPDSFDSRVTQLELIHGPQRVRFKLPAGRVICRTTFDAALVESANSVGATVLTGAHAVVEPELQDKLRCVTVVLNGRRETIRTPVVICADGISHTSVRQLPEFVVSTAVNSRVGVGAVVTGDFEACPIGQITMVLSRSGYVGISRAYEHRFNIAAAIDRTALLRTAPAKIVTDILFHAGIRFPPELLSAHWRGTPPLTSRPARVAFNRVFLIGDAGGYIEPFTGEGMAAALEAALAVTPLVVRATQLWTSAIADEWEMRHKKIVRDRQRTCRQLAWILRRPWAAIAALSVCRMLPGIAARLIAKTSHSTTICGAGIGI